MSLETRSNSALMKRAEQLKRWQDSETFREPSEPKRKSRKVGFSDGCVFLAACAAGDKSEVKLLLDRGADIDTANVDGLTALHQACIDDNLEMVEFLVEHGADVNRGDNEGWTPLHATASCGFLSIARYLLDHGADVAAVNNDGELAIDISESDEMEDLLQKEIDVQNVDCEVARNCEESSMLNDARQWLNSGVYGDAPHHKTGASALHVAAAKGYTRVMNLLIQAGAQVNTQDYDGWTPLHAAAHWAQREACQILADNYVNMDIKNCVGQTAFDVADPDVLRLLEELKKKQANLQKDRPEIAALINRPPTQPQPNKRSPNIGYSHNNNNNNNNIINNPSAGSGIANSASLGLERSSITRLSYDDKLQRSKEATVKETIQEEKGVNEDGGRSSATGGRMGSDQPGLVVTDESGKDAVPGFLPPHPELGQQGREEVASWRRPASLRARPSTSTAPAGKLSPGGADEGSVVRRAHSFSSDDKRRVVSEDNAGMAKQSPDLSVRPKLDKNLNTQVRRSFVPPVRDEEHEIQRKAHAKRVRETRRSTQGVTLEDLKSAEQLVKKKQQQENAQRTTELVHLANNNSLGSAAQTATTTVSTSATIVPTTNASLASHTDKQERKPSWRLKVDPADKSKFTLEDTRSTTLSATTGGSGSLSTSNSLERRISRLASSAGQSLSTTSQPTPASSGGSATTTAASVASAAVSSASQSAKDTESNPGSPCSTPTQLAINRKKKARRRPTAQVVIDLEELDTETDDQDENVPTSSSQPQTDKAKKSQNGDVDYKKLWEESQAENTRLRLEMSNIRAELDRSKRQLDTAMEEASTKHAVSDSEKREKKMLEKKLAEMEEELKTLEQLKSDNQRLRDENGALIRVISKLSK